MIEILPNYDMHMTLLSRWQCQFNCATNLMGVPNKELKTNPIVRGIN